MPKQYEEIKKSYLRRGKSPKEAKKLAAMTYNARHPGHPMRPLRKRRREHFPRPDKHGFY